MAAPEESIRQYLDRHGGRADVSVRQAIASWRLDDPTREDRARIAGALAAVGVEAQPPLDQGDLDSRVTLRVAAAEPDRPAGAPPPGAAPRADPVVHGRPPARPASGPERSAPSRRGVPAQVRGLDDRVLLGALAAGLVGSLIALGPDRIYGYGLALGVVAIALLIARGGLEGGPALGGVRLTWVAGALGALALVLGVVGSLTLGGTVQVGTSGADVAEREAFCDSEAGDKLDRLGLSGTRSAEKLREATDAVLDIAEDAPPGADCAVFALNSLAHTWNAFAGFPEYEDAAEQVERIRELQAERGLREPVI